MLRVALAIAQVYHTFSSQEYILYRLHIELVARSWSPVFFEHPPRPLAVAGRQGTLFKPESW